MLDNELHHHLKIKQQKDNVNNGDNDNDQLHYLYDTLDELLVKNLFIEKKIRREKFFQFMNHA